jgi:hypothetical protein
VARGGQRRRLHAAGSRRRCADVGAHGGPLRRHSGGALGRRVGVRPRARSHSPRAAPPRRRLHDGRSHHAHALAGGRQAHRLPVLGEPQRRDVRRRDRHLREREPGVGRHLGRARTRDRRRLAGGAADPVAIAPLRGRCRRVGRERATLHPPQERDGAVARLAPLGGDSLSRARRHGTRVRRRAARAARRPPAPRGRGAAPVRDRHGAARRAALRRRRNAGDVRARRARRRRCSRST